VVASYTQGNFNARGTINRLTVAGGTFADSFVAAWRIGQVSLEATRNTNPGTLYGLVYERLGGYQGPGDVLELVDALKTGSAGFPALPGPINPNFVPFTPV